MKYIYYNLYGDIYRGKNSISSTSYDASKAEIYIDGSWKMSEISTINLLRYTDTVRITKDEAFMELL